MSIRRAIVAAWRNFIEGRALDLPRYDDGFHMSEEAQARARLQVHAEALMRTFLPRLPEHLHSALEHVVVRSNVPPTDQLSLMNRVSELRTGLGIANERGGIPSEEDRQLYQRLSELEHWMDQDLGHPEDSDYAVLRRAVERLERNSEGGGSAA